jgi:hypothetical protein
MYQQYMIPIQTTKQWKFSKSFCMGNHILLIHSVILTFEYIPTHVHGVPTPKSMFASM